MNKRLIYSILLCILILSINFVSANAFATIGMQGLSYASPEIGEAINLAMCVSSVVSCIEGKIIGQVKGEAMKTLAKEVPEATATINAYNQIQGFVDTGAEIVEELELGEDGSLEQGEIFFEKESSIGNLVLESLEAEDISVEGIDFEKRKGVSTLTFNRDNSKVCIYEDCFENIVPQFEANHPTQIKMLDGEIQSADFTVNEEGGTYNFGGTSFQAPPNSRVFFDKDQGILKIKTEGYSELIGPPTAGDYDLNVVGEKIILPGGDLVRGDFYYTSEGLKLGEEGHFESKGVTITKLIGLGKTSIYFDKPPQEEEYILFGKDAFEVSQELGILEVNFDKNNPYALIEEGDRLDLELVGEGNIKLLNRRDVEGKIPSLEINSDRYWKIMNDQMSFESTNEEVRFKKSIFRQTSTPLEIKFPHEKNAPKMIIDNFDRYALFPEGELEQTNSFEGIDVNFDSRIKYNYPSKKEVEELTGKKINFEGLTRGEASKATGRLRDYLSNIPGGSGSSEINILSDREFDKEWGGNNNAAAFARYIGEDTFYRPQYLNYETFRHEEAHISHFDLQKRNIFEFYYEKIPGTREFDEEWEEIVGTEAYEKIALENEDGYWVYSQNPDKRGPRNGFMRAYGNSNQLEDVATFVEKVGEPEAFAQLITPGNEQYHPDYKKKLDLLRKYNFISETEYKTIILKGGLYDEDIYGVPEINSDRFDVVN